MDIKKFLSDNNLKQKDLVEYLGISKPFASQVANGTSKLGTENLTKLLTNPYGWDTAALVGASISASATHNSTANVNIGGHDIAALKKEIEMLRAQLEEEKQRSAQYWEMIQKLMK